MYHRPNPMTGADFYEVQNNHVPSYTQLSATHHGHPWPGLVEVSGGADDAKAFVQKNAMYLGGGALIALGLVSWKMGWFK